METYNYISASNYSEVRDLAHGIKKNDLEAIDKASKMMAPYVPENAVLVPVPGHNGMLGSSLDLSLKISKLTNTPIDYGMSGKKRQSNYEAKLTGHPLKAEDMGFVYKGSFPDNKVPVFIDNVIATGETAKGVMDAFYKVNGDRKGFLLVLGDDKNAKRNFPLINLLPSVPFKLRENKPTLYTMWKVDDKTALEKKYPSELPNKYYDHSTVDYGLQSFDAREGSKTKLKVIGRLTTDKVDTLLLEPKPEDKNVYPHITLATADGIKPKESNTELEKHLSQVIPVNDEIEATFTNFFAKPKEALHAEHKDECEKSMTDRIFDKIDAMRHSETETEEEGEEANVAMSFRR